MKAMKRILVAVILAAMLCTVLFSVSASAFESYDTFTYSIDLEELRSPTAYSASAVFDSAKMGLTSGKYGTLALRDAKDLVTDHESNVYIADSGNNRIVVLNKYYSVIRVIDGYTDEFGRAQTFSNPSGLFVTDPTKTANGESFIYVCDTDHGRIVVFDREYQYVRTIVKPNTSMVTEQDFKPTAIAVDIYGRIFVVSNNSYKGVIVLSGEGDFTGFIGAQKVTYSLIQMIWRRFQSREQRTRTTQSVSIAYNNITVDDDGFIYVTIEQKDKTKQLASIKSKNADYSPVKKLNSAGVEIMSRNGFADPGGKADILNAEDVSRIIDVAVGPEESWSILDVNDSRVYTYDNDGNLLFAFGDKGDQLGNGEEFVSMTYHKVTDTNGKDVYYLILLDNASVGYKLTVFTPTTYCDTIMSALRNQNEHNYSDSIRYWQDVLTKNNNFDLAYIGIGKALYNQGKYTEAMEMLKSAYETTQYSKAFSQVRREILGTWMIPILIVLIGLIVLLVKFLGYAKKKNKAVSLKVGKKTYKEELLYAFHLIFHPFDGFWDLKHEYRGSVRAGTTILGFTILAFFYQAIGRGYIFNPRETYSTIFVQILSVAVPVLLFCLGSWCLTTLFDGEGSFKDIYVAVTYSLTPLPFMVILSTILTNVLTKSEGSIVNLIVTFGYIWVALLIFFGTLVTQDYSLGKNVLITIFTIVAMAVIMFVAILFSSLVIKMVTFIVSIFQEIGYRT